MTLDSFLTVQALLAAIYALLPAVQRFRLERAWRAQGLLGIVAIVVILALELYEGRSPACLLMLCDMSRWLILPDGEVGASRSSHFL